MNNETKSIIACHDLQKSFTVGGKELAVLRGISLSIQKGDFVAITGRSGAGKSTLLYQLSLLDKPTGGSVIIDDLDAAMLDETTRTAIRLTQFGYVFQSYALVPELTAAENVMAPAIMRGLTTKEAKSQAVKALKSVGLGERMDNLPSTLSGGEQQRVAIARAIAHSPAIVFADEPTANLDATTARAVMDVFASLHRAGQTIVMITHEENFDRYFSRMLNLQDGTLISDGKQK